MYKSLKMGQQSNFIKKIAVPPWCRQTIDFASSFCARFPRALP